MSRTMGRPMKTAARTPSTTMGGLSGVASRELLDDDDGRW